MCNFFYSTLLRFPRKSKKILNTGLPLSRFEPKKLKYFVVRIRLKCFREIWHDNRTVFYDNFFLNSDQNFVCFTREIPCSNFSRSLHDGYGIYLNKSGNSQFFVQALIGASMRHFTPNGPKNLVLFPLRICSNDFSEIVHSDTIY